MSVREGWEAVLLGGFVLATWIGVIGMLRMREPMQSLHFLSFPSLASVLLAGAVFTAAGASQASWKTLLIAVVLLASNAIVTHATARAFRARELGHWEALDGDPIEFTRDDRARGKEAEAS
jgi:multisubunit Na+/H+ antiporter MnhG subunit